MALRTLRNFKDSYLLFDFLYLFLQLSNKFLKIIGMIYAFAKNFNFQREKKNLPVLFKCFDPTYRKWHSKIEKYILRPGNARMG